MRHEGDRPRDDHGEREPANRHKLTRLAVLAEATYGALERLVLPADPVA